MVEFSLLFRAHPNGCLPFKVNLIRQLPRPIAAHRRDVLHQTFCNMLEGVEVIVEDDYFVVGIVFGVTSLARSGATVGAVVIATSKLEDTEVIGVAQKALQKYTLSYSTSLTCA